MPGRVLFLTPVAVTGWATHPRLPDYRVVVSVVHRSAIIASGIADADPASDQAPAGAGFRIALHEQGLSPADLARLRLRIGETDEWIEMPDDASGRDAAPLTVEDILVGAHRPRPWVNGATYVDAEAAGLAVETILDMLYRDYLGRPSDAHGLDHYAAAVRSGADSYDDVRRSFIAADEYRQRPKHVDNAPGSIFSQGIVMAAARAGGGAAAIPAPADPAAAARERFVKDLYRRLLRQDPTPARLAHYMGLMAGGAENVAIIREVAAELDALNAEDEAPRPPGVVGERGPG